MKVLFFEDFIKDIDKTLVDIYDFLEIDNTFKTSHFLINKKTTGAPKSKLLNSILQKSSKLDTLKTILHKVVGEDKTKLFRELIMRKNLSKSKLILDDTMKSQLESYFEDDVQALQTILPDQKINWFSDGKNS